MIGYKAWSFIRRDFQIETSYKINFVLVLAGSILPIFAFYFISKLVPPGEAESLAKYGGLYFPFVMIGLTFARQFQLAVRIFSQSIRAEQLTGCLEAMLSSQTSPELIVLMSSLYGLIFSTIQAVIMFLVGIFVFGFDISQINIFASLVVFLLSLLTFISFGVLSAAFIIVLKKGDPFSWLLSELSVIMGGSYFPVSAMPDWLQAVSKVLPTTYALDALRLTIIKGYSLSQVAHPVIVLGLMALILFPLSMKVFLMAVKQAKKDGTLVQY